MAQRLQVPEFGKWEGAEEVSYTAYFERARRGKSGSRNDSQENPPSTMEVESGAQKVAVDLAHRRHGGVIASKHEAELVVSNGSETLQPKRESQEDHELRRPTNFPLHQDTVGRKHTTDSPVHCYGGGSSGDTRKRAVRQSVGSDCSTEQSQSPLHRHHQARVAGKGGRVSSPSWERKGSSEGSGHGLAPLTPGRSRLRSVTRDDTDEGAAVPKFGDWDESNPASADGYSHIFEKVREERQIGAGKVPAMVTETSRSYDEKQDNDVNSKSCCCFPWSRR